jgi:hypothetical protein
LLEVDGDHFSVADASSPAWPTVIDALEELTGRGIARPGYKR